MSGALGLFGGSFDPPHIGHVLAACYVLSACEVDDLWVVPTFRHPFGKPLAAFEHRLEMCERAFAPLRHCHVSDIEREIGGTSYTVQLLEAVAARNPGRPLRLVLGTDILSQTRHWQRFDRVVELAPPLIIQRTGHAGDAPAAPSMPEVSSTDVRTRLGRGQSVEGLVPVAVSDYAREHALYGGWSK